MDIILYNPLSRNGKSQSIVDELVLKLKAEGKDTVVHSILEIPSVANFIQGVQKEDRVIILGGDGTLHHLVNSIRGYDITQPIYVLKAGTGNDFIRSIPSKEHLIQINEYTQDLPKVTINGEESLFLNGTGMGVDAYVCHLVNTSTKKKSAANYFKNALKAFLTYKPSEATVTIDGVSKTYKKVWFVLAANSVYMGGGMKFSPSSIREDDLLEFMIIHRVPRFILFLIFPTIYFGKHIWFKRWVTIIQGKTMDVAYGKVSFLQKDGESVNHVQSMHIER
jgi:diacylglycerol kinase (ATP)